MKTLYFLTLFLLQNFVFAQSFNWEWQNTKPSGNDLCDVVALSPTKVLAFGVAGIQLMSTDAGANWSLCYIDPSRNDLWSSYFLDQNNGYVCGGGGLIMRTTDGGNSWTKLTTNLTSTLYDIEFLDANNGIAVGSAGILTKTTDGGSTWNSINVNGSTTATIYHVTIVNSSIVLLGTGSSTPGRFLKSTDFGATFTSIIPTGITATVYGIAAISSSTYYVTSATGVVSLTTNGGTNWSTQTTPGVWVCDIKFQDSNIGFVTDQKGNVWKTTNGGTNWVSQRLIYRSTTGSAFQLKSSSYNSGNLFVVGYSGGIYKSTDNGSTWNSLFTTASQEILRKVVFTTSTQGYAFGGSGTASEGVGVVIQTSDGGNNWSVLNSSIQGQVNSVAMPSSNTWYIGCNNSKFYKTTNGGLTFSSITTTPVITTSFATAFIDENTGFAGGLSGKVSKTTDGGATWTDLSTAAGFGTNAVYDIAILDANNLFISGGGSRIVKSTDAGGTFTTATSGLTGTLFFSIKFRNSSEGFTCGAGLFRTTNGGSSWSAVTLPGSFGTANITSIFLGSGTDIWITSQNGDILYSPDNGTNWTYPDRATTGTLNSIAVSGSDIWVAGNGGVLLHSSQNALPVQLSSFTAKVSGAQVFLLWHTATEINNHGFEIERKLSDNENTVWKKIGFIPGSGNSNSPNEYSFIDRNIPSGKYLYRLKQIDNNGSFLYSQNVEILFSPYKYNLEQNYPNPFNPSTTIRYSIAERGAVRLIVYNTLGEEIAVLLDSFVEPGSYEVKFDASRLASGIYLYKLECGNIVLSNKMILIK